MNRIFNYINGQLVEPESKQYLENYDPAVNEAYSEVPDSDANDVDLAVNAAKNAFKKWSSLSSKERSDYLMEISNAIVDNLEDLAAVESRDNGKPYNLAKSVDIPRAASNFEFYASGAQHFASEFHNMHGTAINYTLRQPLGVVGTISPWNLPLYLFTWKIAPALAVGNTVVAKPSEITPFSAFELSKIAIDIELPPGVLNIVHGLGPKVGEAITSNEHVMAISFTGGTSTGKRIAEKVAPQFKKLSLEMGGKNPNIIFDDCNFDKMLETTLRSSFSNQGQICLCGSRIYVQKGIYEKFKSEFVKKTEELTVGDPSTDVDLGAIVSNEHFEKIMSYVELAKEEGGTILTGGKSVKPEGRCENGFFIRPTIIEGLDHTCRTNQEEIFGPVVTIQPFDTEEEVLEYANSTEYGLAAILWTENATRVHRMAPKIDTGILWVNCWMVRDLRTPFGGMKNSGVGREGGFEAMRFFTEEKNVTVQYGD